MLVIVINQQQMSTSTVGFIETLKLTVQLLSSFAMLCTPVEWVCNNTVIVNIQSLLQIEIYSTDEQNISFYICTKRISTIHISVCSLITDKQITDTLVYIIIQFQGYQPG